MDPIVVNDPTRKLMQGVIAKAIMDIEGVESYHDHEPISFVTII